MGKFGCQAARQMVCSVHWGSPRLVIDASSGAGNGFSLEGAQGVQFVARTKQRAQRRALAHVARDLRFRCPGGAFGPERSRQGAGPGGHVTRLLGIESLGGVVAQSGSAAQVLTSQYQHRAWGVVHNALTHAAQSA